MSDVGSLTAERLAELAAVLDRGGVLAVPTGSSYGLAADPESAAGVALVFEIKRRPAAKPLPVIVPDLATLRALGGRPEAAERAGLTALWPAPLTILMPSSRPLPAAAGSDRVAFRIPAEPRLRRLLSDLGRGLTATSANRSGRPALHSPRDLEPLLAGYDAAIVDAGELPGGAPSTLVDVDEEGRVRILRQGRYELPREIPVAFSAAAVEIAVEETR